MKINSVMKFAHSKRRIIFPSLLLTAALFLNACGTQNTAAPAVSAPAPSPSASDSARNTITVNSSEQVTVTPDIVQIVFTVRTEEKDAADCQKKNMEEAGKVIELLKSLGIEENSIRTSDYYMSPRYSYAGNTQKLTGYEAASTLTVSNLPIDELGNILNQSVSAGVNDIQSITYQSSRYDESYQEALTLAMASAKAKAEVLAQAGNGQLGGLAGVVENSNYSQARYTDNALASKIRAAGTMQTKELLADETGIMPGEIEVEVNITVEYLLQ